MTQTLNRWLPPVTLAAWSAILLYFHQSGRLAAFLHPMFRPGVLLAGAVLLLFAIATALGSREECCEHCCGHSDHGVTRMTFGKLLSFAMLLVPLALAVATSRDSFGLTAIQNRGVATEASALARGKDDNTGTNEQYIPKTADGNIAASVIDLIYAAQDPSLRSDFEGKTVEIVGQLMAEKSGSTGNRMKVVRMFMTCCAADAKPVAALIELPAKTDVPELSWVRVVGKPAFPSEGGKTVAVMKVESIKPTSPPGEAMLF